jgi:hypothetical protein
MYQPTETHKTLYRKISSMLRTGASYGEVGKMLLPDKDPDAAKQICYRLHKKNMVPKDNSIRMMLGLPRYFLVQENVVTSPDIFLPPTTVVLQCTCGRKFYRTSNNMRHCTPECRKGSRDGSKDQDREG